MHFSTPPGQVDRRVVLDIKRQISDYNEVRVRTVRTLSAANVWTAAHGWVIVNQNRLWQFQVLHRDNVAVQYSCFLSRSLDGNSLPYQCEEPFHLVFSSAPFIGSKVPRTLEIASEYHYVLILRSERTGCMQDNSSLCPGVQCSCDRLKFKRGLRW